MIIRALEEKEKEALAMCECEQFKEIRRKATPDIYTYIYLEL